MLNLASTMGLKLFTRLQSFAMTHRRDGRPENAQCRPRQKTEFTDIGTGGREFQRVFIFPASGMRELRLLRLASIVTCNQSAVA